MWLFAREIPLEEAIVADAKLMRSFRATLVLDFFAHLKEVSPVIPT
jgi:hypothetical protein